MTPDQKHCPACNNDLPNSAFGKCKARKDGKNLYCSECCNQRVKASRRALKEYKAIQKRTLQLIEQGEIEKLERKPMVMSPIQKQTAKEKVYEAIESGCRTRQEIRLKTNLRWDPLSDALAVLWDEGSVVIEKVQGQACFMIRGERRVKKVA